MGDFYERIVDVEVTGEEARPLAERMVAWMVAEGRVDEVDESAGPFNGPSLKA